eukprot:8865461-Pyramimonas_sp.AAC.1
MKEVKADIILVSETHLQQSKVGAKVAVENAIDNLGYGCKCTLGTQNNSGVMMAWGKAGIQATHFEEGPEGRALFATVVTG